MTILEFKTDQKWVSIVMPAIPSVAWVFIFCMSAKSYAFKKVKLATLKGQSQIEMRSTRPRIFNVTFKVLFAFSLA